MKNIVILISGRGSNMEAIVQDLRRRRMGGEGRGGDQQSRRCGGTRLRKANGIATAVVEHRAFASREGFDAALAAAIDAFAPDVRRRSPASCASSTPGSCSATTAGSSTLTVAARRCSPACTPTSAPSTPAARSAGARRRLRDGRPRPGPIIGEATAPCCRRPSRRSRRARSRGSMCSTRRPCAGSSRGRSSDAAAWCGTAVVSAS